MEEENAVVKNFQFFDSDEDEDDMDVEVIDPEDYDSVDEETEHFQETLSHYLRDIAQIDSLGLKVYKIDFHDTRIDNLEDKDCDCDFDLDEDKCPIMPEGGEEFIIPYLVQLSKQIPYFADCTYETNINIKIKLY